MKATVFFLALSVLIATSNTQNTQTQRLLQNTITEKNVTVNCYKKISVEGEPNKRVVFTDGKIGPGDALLATLSSVGEPCNYVDFQETTWRLTDVKALIACIVISEVGPSTNATAIITSGGVGSDYLNFKTTPYKGGSYNFEVKIYGTATELPNDSKLESNPVHSDKNKGRPQPSNKWFWQQR